MRRTASLAAALILAFSALPLRADEAASDLPLGDPARREKAVTPALDVVTDTRTASPVSPAEVAQKLAKMRLVFLGESHTSAEFHRVQLQVIRELHRAGRKVLVGLEMFPVAEQLALDLWNGGTLSEAEFVEKSRWYRNWGYHWNYYRDIFLFCRDAKIPLYGVNVPRELVSDVRKKGFDGLTAEQKTLVPPKIDVENADHRRLFKAFFEDSDTMHSASMPETMWDGMFRAQCTWDAAMAWNAVGALKKANDPNAVMVVLIGSGHVAYGLGAQRQAALWFDGAAASVIPIPVLDDKDRPAKVRASYADFVWGV
ncbi:MAG TPA: ChaN family lipoprotein, partial [Thermoanaerobaculia bacterium]|nr:ChaN family lipoprotein [Thermoanaerobaculia bacterium]